MLRADRLRRRKVSACARVQRGCIRGGTGSRVLALSVNDLDAWSVRWGRYRWNLGWSLGWIFRWSLTRLEYGANGYRPLLKQKHPRLKRSPHLDDVNLDWVETSLRSGRCFDRSSGRQPGRDHRKTRMDQPMNRTQPRDRMIHATRHHAGRRRALYRTPAGPCVSRDDYSSSSATSAAAPTGAAAAIAFTPSDSRIRFSISRAISGFSRRNSRALSLP